MPIVGSRIDEKVDLDHERYCDLAEISLGRCELRKLPFSLRGLIEDVTVFFENQTGTDKTEFVCIVSKDMPTFVVGDSRQLRQALNNLLKYVRSFIGEGQAVLHIGLATVKGGDISVQFDILQKRDLDASRMQRQSIESISIDRCLHGSAL
jgi:signal transduction histidine kinase